MTEGLVIMSAYPCLTWFPMPARTGFTGFARAPHRRLAHEPSSRNAGRCDDRCISNCSSLPDELTFEQDQFADAATVRTGPGWGLPHQWSALQMGKTA
jgi:hypothetical protein